MPIHALPVIEMKADFKAQHAEVHYFQVIAPTPVLTGELNAVIAADAGILGVAQDTQDRLVGCDAGLVTDAFVSWSCHRAFFESGGATQRTSRAYFIDKGVLRAATLANVFVADIANRLSSIKGKQVSVGSPSDDGPECVPDPKHQLFFFDGGVMFADDYDTCTVAWDKLQPLLRPNSVVRQIVDGNVEPAPDDPKAAWKKAQPRFVAQGDTVLDRATNLQWAAKDNGADIDHAGARKFAADATIGGFDDWRLPTEEELEVLSDPSLAHRNKADCTKGKNALLVTSLIKLSCGLAWSASAGPTGMVGFGFISGTPRVSKPTEKKNYRALVVR